MSNFETLYSVEYLDTYILIITYKQDNQFNTPIVQLFNSVYIFNTWNVVCPKATRNRCNFSFSNFKKMVVLDIKKAEHLLNPLVEMIKG